MCSTRKQIECLFGIIKFRFLILKFGVRLSHEDDISFLATACPILNDMSINSGDEVDDETIWDNAHQLYSIEKSLKSSVNEG